MPKHGKAWKKTIKYGKFQLTVFNLPLGKCCFSTLVKLGADIISSTPSSAPSHAGTAFFGITKTPGTIFVQVTNSPHVDGTLCSDSYPSQVGNCLPRNHQESIPGVYAPQRPRNFLGIPSPWPRRTCSKLSGWKHSLKLTWHFRPLRMVVSNP